MDFSSYSDENLLDMARKRLEVPDSCKARLARLLQTRSHINSDPTPKEAAHKLGSRWSPKKIRKLLRRGKIPGRKIAGNWYVDPDWVEKQLEIEEFNNIIDEEDGDF